ncbi:4-hydroxy-tetrahydrodipicolinate reductase [candidate division KSB3 bacterium]|uniref:4-hydroxy-tetrahydrodipicolinate reductase n=1 Tax=candidate division KSB3 bacterium TaxID=2044937 RepID=A0A2G6E2N3_9BACT|nr:MAG: 4-hydroxy-tetrahydrodipicolinate reductase [candidate division KSB3 bacterium]PIE29298.1 MAG: 4-hydroxy-tetrahydrodipicolinate reductase [candidate division KSB3 bacterium]
MLNVLLCGCYGHMGKIVTEILYERADITLIGVDGMPSQGVANFPIFTSFDDVNIASDVIIDFSHHTLILSLLDYAERSKTPAVICTTGLDEEIHARMKDVAESVPILHSGNMSVGVNLLLKLVRQAAAVLTDNFDIELIERHHNRKLDAPSGTAYMIADAINEELNSSKYYTFGRKGKDTKRKAEEIAIHSVRGGTIVGEHSVIFAGTDEVIEISHKAYSRRLFAVGAVKAARFLVKQEPGLYSMDDVL